MFLGIVDPDRQVAITALTHDVMAFLAERFGAIAPDFTLYIVNDEEARVAKMQEVLGDTPPLQCGLAEKNIVFIQEWCADGAIAHEYSHVLQELWAPKALAPPSDTGWEWGAWWLFEGAAEYAEMEYGETVNVRTPGAYGTGIDFRMWSASHARFPLRDLESYRPSVATTPYDLAALAVDWLATQTSDGAVAGYFQLLVDSADWRAAFRSAFEMTTDEFYREFEEYRADVLPIRRDVRGIVTGPDGEPVTRWRLDVEAHPHGWRSRRSGASDVAFDGSFLLEIPDGTYGFLVTGRCGSRYPDFGWHGGERGLVSSPEQAVPVTVAGSDVTGIEIRLSAEPPEVDAACDFGPTRAVSGTVSGPDGAPLGGIHVYAWDEQRWGALGVGTALTHDDGSFVLLLPDGVFEVSLIARTEGRLRIPPWGFQFEVKPGAIVTVDGDDVPGIEIRILAQVDQADRE